MKKCQIRPGMGHIFSRKRQKNADVVCGGEGAWQASHISELSLLFYEN